MTSHELARKLLEGLDLPVEVHVGTPHDTFVGDIGDCVVRDGTVDIEGARLRGYDVSPGRCVVLRGWMSSEDAG